MLTNLIENRGREFSNFLKLGDYLSRSLRENIELFSVEKSQVTYLTESGHLIQGKFSTSPLRLTDIVVENSDILENEEVFSKITDNKIQSLLFNLLEDDYSGAEDSFDDILGLFETKLSFNRIRDRLHEKTLRFGPQTKITSSKEFSNVVEVKDKLVTFLKENKNLVNIPEIRNALKLAFIVSNSFDIPKLTLEDIKTSKVYKVSEKANNSIYEHLCRQELISKELLEAKENFDKSWAYNDAVSDIATLIYDTNEDTLVEAIAKAISSVPYLALATKKQLRNLFVNSLSLNDMNIPSREINEFVGKVYATKKPVKDYIVGLLNEKYGINVSTLTDVPTFTNLLKTETVIFTALSRLAPKKSVLKDTLASLAESLKLKNGVESIDIVTFLYDVFTEAGFSDEINETSLMSYLDFNQVAQDLGKIGAILKMIKPIVAGEAGGGMGGDPMTQPQDLGGEMGDGLGDELGGDELEEVPLEGGLEDDGDTIPDPNVDPQGVADEVQDMEDGVGDEEGMEGEEGEFAQEEPEEDPQEYVDADELTSLMASIEDVLGSIKGELGIEDEEEGMDSEFSDEFEDEGSEEGGEFEAEEEPDEFEDEDEPQEEEMPKKKKKEPPFQKK